MEEEGIDNKTVFAEEIGISRTTLVHLALYGAERIWLSTVEKLCKKLNVMPNDLFNITNDDGTPWKPEKKKKKMPHAE